MMIKIGFVSEELYFVLFSLGMWGDFFFMKAHVNLTDKLINEIITMMLKNVVRRVLRVREILSEHERAQILRNARAY